MDYEDSAGYDLKKSKFNAGVAFAIRIDSLQKEINVAKFNPLAVNPMTGTFNYKNLIAALDCLISEGWGKFTVDERKESLRLLAVLIKMDKYFPPVMSEGEEASLHQENFDKFIEIYGLAERKIKEFYDEHDLNSPSRDEDDDYDY